MKLEDEIKQQKFRSEYLKLVVNLNFTYFWAQDRMRATLKPYDISLQQFNVLRILRGQFPNPSTINLIKDRMLDKSSDASRLVERLRLKGLVQRGTSPTDRRSVDILITQQGLDLLKNIDAEEARFDAIYGALSLEEAQLLNDLLDKARS